VSSDFQVKGPDVVIEVIRLFSIKKKSGGRDPLRVVEMQGPIVDVEEVSTESRPPLQEVVVTL